MRGGISILKEPASRLLQKKRGTTRAAPRKSTPKEEGGGDNLIEAQRASMQRVQYSPKPFKLQEIYCGAKLFNLTQQDVKYIHTKAQKQHN